MSDEVVLGFYAASRHYARRMTSELDAEDLIQEGVLAAWRATQQGDRDDPRAWGATAARSRILNLAAHGYPQAGSETPGRKVADQSRKRAGLREGDFDTVALTIADVAETYSEVEIRIDVTRAMRSLDQRDRHIAMLVGIGQQWTEIGERVGMGHHAVKKRWHSIIKPALRDAINQTAERETA